MKNFVSMNMDTYSKDRMNKINEHNKNRMNNDKKINYLLDKKLDDNVHYTFRKIEDLEAKKPKGFGIEASKFQEIIGKKLNKNLNQWDFLTENDLEK